MHGVTMKFVLNLLFAVFVIFASVHKDRIFLFL